MGAGPHTPEPPGIRLRWLIETAPENGFKVLNITPCRVNQDRFLRCFWGAASDFIFCVHIPNGFALFVPFLRLAELWSATFLDCLGTLFSRYISLVVCISLGAIFSQFFDRFDPSKGQCC